MINNSNKVKKPASMPPNPLTCVMLPRRTSPRDGRQQSWRSQ